MENKQELSQLLETKDKVEQAKRVRHLLDLARTPVAVITILYDPRMNQVLMSPMGAKMEYKAALEILEAAKNQVVEAMMKAQQIEVKESPA